MRFLMSAAKDLLSAAANRASRHGLSRTKREARDERIVSNGSGGSCVFAARVGGARDARLRRPRFSLRARAPARGEGRGRRMSNVGWGRDPPVSTHTLPFWAALSFPSLGGVTG